MREDRVLYQIKSLEKMIARYFCTDKDNDLPIEKIVPPLTPTQMEIIEYIKKHSDEEVYQRDLENVLNLRRATVSGVLQTMERNGLLERVTHTEDARTKRIILNYKAEQVFSLGEKRLYELESIVTKGIDDKDIIIFSKVITQMKNNLKEEKERRE